METTSDRSQNRQEQDDAISQAVFGPDSRRWRFSFPPLEELNLYRLCHVDFPVMHWAPRRAEVERFAELALTLHGDKPGRPIVLEVGSGSGLLSYLLADTGKVEVIALDPDPEHARRTPYRSDAIRHVVADAAQAVELFGQSDITIVLNSWMPPQVNLTPAIRMIGASAIVYVLESRGETGIPETYAPSLRFRYGNDLEDRVSYRPGKNYQRICEWDGPAQWEITEWPKRHFYAESIRDSNKIDVQVKRSIPPGVVYAALDRMESIDSNEFPHYPWEAELSLYKGELPGRIRRAAETGETGTGLQGE